VADWRVVFEDPADINVGPEIPEDAQWKSRQETQHENADNGY